MRFDLYPLDEHICKFRVGSTNLDITRMRFDETKKSYDPTKKNTILDYAVEISQLRENDRYVFFICIVWHVDELNSSIFILLTFI